MFRCDFTGTLIVVPDVGALNLPGASAESGARHRGAGDNAEGLRGLKALGVRDLNYRMSFLACGVSSAGWIPQSTHRVAIADFWRTSHPWWKSQPRLVKVGGARPPPFSLWLSRTKLQCTLKLRGQIHSPCFLSPLSILLGINRTETLSYQIPVLYLLNNFTAVVHGSILRPCCGTGTLKQVSGSIGSTCFLGLLDPDPIVRGMDPDPSLSIIKQPKIVRKTLISTAFVTSFWLFTFKKLCKSTFRK